jgi:hypothetical protein
MPGKRVATRRSRQNTLLTVLIVAAAAVLLLAIGWLVLSDRSIFNGDGDAVADGQEVAGDPSSPATDAATPAEDAGPVAPACSAEISAAEQVAAAADAGVRHWNAHVQARTDMLKGRISETRMSAIWKRTQDAGPGDQQQFSTAQQDYDGQPSCDELHNDTESHSEAVTDCLARSEAATTAVSAAEAAMNDWASHLHHMSEYADGGMTAGRAQRLWVTAWRQAPENITAYEDARTALSEAPPCDDTGD